MEERLEPRPKRVETRGDERVDRFRHGEILDAPSLGEHARELLAPVIPPAVEPAASRDRALGRAGPAETAGLPVNSDSEMVVALRPTPRFRSRAQGAVQRRRSGRGLGRRCSKVEQASSAPVILTIAHGRRRHLFRKLHE
jgi:hypothetical protein